MSLKNTNALPFIVGVIFLILGLVLGATPMSFLATESYILAALLLGMGIGIGIGASQRK